MARPIDNGTTEIFDPAHQRVVGYAFVEDGTVPEAQQVQRWILYAEYHPPPTATAVFRQPSNSARRYTRLDEWVAAIRQGDLWKSGAQYVKVNCVSHDAITLPPEDRNQQLYKGVTTLIQSVIATGYACATAVTAGTYQEHWVMFDGYRSAPGATIEAGPTQGAGAPTLIDFLRDMKSSWRAGSTYVICDCTAFSALPDTL